MSVIKINLYTFHKRIINLNILRLFYFIKKEFNTNVSKLLHKKTTYKLFNILKSPVRHKVGRNQLAIPKYKTSLFLNLVPFLKKLHKIKPKVIFDYFVSNLKNKLSSSNCNLLFQKYFRV